MSNLCFAVVLCGLGTAPFVSCTQGEFIGSRTPTNETALVEVVSGVQIVTRYRDRSNNPSINPDIETDGRTSTIEKRAETIWVRFEPGFVHGHADLDKPVRCLLFENKNGELAYGVYGLWKDKSDLEMPLPSDDASVVWDGVSGRDALVRLLKDAGLSKEQVVAIQNRHFERWLGGGLRAIMLHGSELNGKPNITVTVYECIPE